ncbi:hypothetical protein CONPUDRAFT_76204 [Coniophora puteana RWD-64-598 SS2]|uniref:Uncharacterized protein n=1 Tax=Coniophora puteana (strain RWD-64-598) TaxID=741705 RepID=A0A5M3MBV5_CONPW|nr:uncharacterized protein CONPUDRAFT_76204 [Coniophora puteana RWD-64-598 SS2]EIW76563.1 hypothetical protein CONPUDRAFT_76204 [Coniophora puteana RWD-64-598 SS2]
MVRYRGFFNDESPLVSNDSPGDLNLLNGLLRVHTPEARKRAEFEVMKQQEHTEAEAMKLTIEQDGDVDQPYEVPCRFEIRLRPTLEHRSDALWEEGRGSSHHSLSRKPSQAGSRSSHVSDEVKEESRSNPERDKESLPSSSKTLAPSPAKRAPPSVRDSDEDSFLDHPATITNPMLKSIARAAMLNSMMNLWGGRAFHKVLREFKLKIREESYKDETTREDESPRVAAAASGANLKVLGEKISMRLKCPLQSVVTVFPAREKQRLYCAPDSSNGARDNTDTDDESEDEESRSQAGPNRASDNDSMHDTMSPKQPTHAGFKEILDTTTYPSLLDVELLSQADTSSMNQALLEVLEIVFVNLSERINISVWGSSDDKIGETGEGKDVKKRADVVCECVAIVLFNEIIPRIINDILRDPKFNKIREARKHSVKIEGILVVIIYVNRVSSDEECGRVLRGLTG